MMPIYVGLAVVLLLLIFAVVHFFEKDPIGSIICLIIACVLLPFEVRKERARLLARENAFRPGFVDVGLLSPIQYEHYCAGLLKNAGWQVKTTSLQDQGADVIGELRGIRLVLQCKKYTNRVGNAAVQDVIGSKAHYRAQVAAVVFLNGYTKAALALAQSNGVHLLHHDQLADLEMLARIP
jgi:HJR/Mrr/RecB family endonuclease